METSHAPPVGPGAVGIDESEAVRPRRPTFLPPIFDYLVLPIGTWNLDGGGVLVENSNSNILMV
jgi:hypothetical protein